MIFSKFRLSITLRSLGVGWREGDLDLLARSETFVSGVFRTLRWDLGHPTHPKDGSGNDIFLMIFWDFPNLDLIMRLNPKSNKLDEKVDIFEFLKLIFLYEKIIYFIRVCSGD